MIYLQRAARGIIVLILLAASGLAIRMAVADSAAHAGTLEGLEKAIRWEPGNADYHRWLAVTLLGRDPKRSESEFREAIHQNAWDAESRIRLGLLLESHGKLAEAHKELLGAVEKDATFLPKWTLANFAFRHDNIPEFWVWAKAAVPMSYGDRSPLFDLAAATGEAGLSGKLGLTRDDDWDSYLGWATAKGSVDEVRKAALHVSGEHRPNLSPAVQQACDRLVDLGGVDEALEVWNAAVKSGLILAGESARGRVTNGNFAVQPSGSGFDWVLEKPAGGAIVRENDHSGVWVRFTGEQAERCSVLAQRVAVSPGTTYRVSVQYRTMGAGRNSGLKWMVSSTTAELARMNGYLSAEKAGSASFQFQAPSGVNWVRLALWYERPPGEMRLEGDIVVQLVEMASL